ncbi:Aste57867_19400 [Aphanomyces stellatus]|uniref:Aste57867_19400 protein n=1 Tax=Aphanomyces stellatus TaxID=120398 RepID=A0A485LD33_9STRA|nr:hypothetical protein As57867_019336 [Aphanomyces stellatus]VFT96114.1 Aste57867_19400 [Aphanomyces stellatus]
MLPCILSCLLVLLAIDNRVASTAGGTTIIVPDPKEAADIDQLHYEKAQSILVAEQVAEITAFSIDLNYYEYNPIPNAKPDYSIGILLDPCHGQDAGCCQDHFGSPAYVIPGSELNIKGLDTIVNEFKVPLDPSVSRIGDIPSVFDAQCFVDAKTGKPYRNITTYNANGVVTFTLDYNSLCIGLHYSAVDLANRPLPACWDSNSSINALSSCHAFDGTTKPNCVSVAYMQTTYIVQCKGKFALDNHCGTFLELHKPGDETILSQTRLFGEFPNGYRTTTLPLFYMGNRSRTVCNGDYEVWWVLRTRFKYVVKFQKKFSIATPLCEFDDVANAYRGYTTLPGKENPLNVHPRTAFQGKMVDQTMTIVASDNNDGGALAVCLCREGYDPRRFMLECAYCEHWFHGSCVQLNEEKAFAISKYACPSCTNKGNQTKYATQAHVLDASLLPLPRQFAALNLKEVLTTPTAAGVDKASDKFHQMLESGMYARSGVRRVSGVNLTATTIQINGFQEPILVEEAVGSVPGLQLPSSPVHVDDLLPILESAKIIKTIDLSSQETRQLSYTDVKSMCTDNQSSDGGSSWSSNIEFPVIDTPLEYQIAPPQGGLSPLFDVCTYRAPLVVHDLDWFQQATAASPEKTFNPNTYMGMYSRHTFRDFSMSASGSSCWLHHVYGLPLTLYLVPPTLSHLEKFVEWRTSATRKHVFLGDLVDKCIKCEVQPNTSILIPAAWMYALYVPSGVSKAAPTADGHAVDATSAVFVTSYFFHGFCMKDQTRVLDMEQSVARKMGTPGRSLGLWPIVASPSQFASPSPEMIMTWIWPAVQRFIHRLKNLHVLTEWEKQGLLAVLPLLRQYDLPAPGDTTIEGLLALLGAKESLLSSMSSTTAAAKTPKAPKKGLPSVGPTSSVASDATSAVTTSANAALAHSFLKRDKKVCKCHLKKCVNCRNCIKRHCICTTQAASSVAGGAAKKVAAATAPSFAVVKDRQPKKKVTPPTTALSMTATTTLVDATPTLHLPPSASITMPQWATDEDEESLRHEATSMWELATDMNQSFFSANELGLNMNGTLELDDAFGIIDMVESSSLFSGYPRDETGPSSTSAATLPSGITIKDELLVASPSPAVSASSAHAFLFGDTSLGGVAVTGDMYYDDNDKDIALDMKDLAGGDMTPNDDGSVRHRASCHRCGNLRKKNVRCLGCPHIFCQKCAEKMVEEHGAQTFIGGCPVCKEMCCCGKNRSTVCRRKFHCYKKCPATKRCNLMSDDMMLKRGDEDQTFKDEDMLMEFPMDDEMGDLDSRSIMAMPSSLAGLDHDSSHGVAAAAASSSLSDCEFEMDLGEMDDSI